VFQKGRRIATSSEDLLPQFHMCKFGQISGSIRHTFDLWILNLFDAGRAKGHFESRQRSTCRPDSPSSNLCASTADSDGVRNVRRHDRWRPPLDRKLPSWSRFSMGHVGPWSVRLAQEPIVLSCAYSLFVSSGALHAAVLIFGIRVLFIWYSSS
jgi:hypothetical protein